MILGLLAATGCSSAARMGGASGGNSGEEEGGSGGSPTGTGGKATGGSGGKATGGSGGGTGGATPSGGAGGGGAGSGGAGGSDAGTTAPADAAPGNTMAVPSMGCGKANPPAGNQMAGGGSYIVVLPTAYDPMKPYPLGIAFHGYGRTSVHCRTDDCPDFEKTLKDQAIVVFMKSIGAGWENHAANFPFFEAVLAAMKSGYCVDERKVFVAGTSSGAAFTNAVACKFGDKLAAVAPVAGPRYDMGCVGTPAAIVIHGVKDNLQNGINARDTYIKRNGCTNTSIPDVAMVHTKVVATNNAFECVSYQGCTKAPVRWCEHNIGGYDGSTHGWPPIASTEIWNFVQMLK